MPATTTKKRLLVLLGILTLFSAAISADEKQLSIYSPVATYSLPVVERSGHQYVGLLELLEPVGRVSSESGGTRWRIRFNAVDGEFMAGKTRGRVQGREVNLTAPFLIENGRGFVSLASLSTLLPHFLGAPVNLHESARRLFVGNVAIRPEFQMVAEPQAHLVINFGAPVNPTVSTEPGTLRMVFKHDPVVSPENQAVSFDNKSITEANFSEANGLAELDVTASIPLIATFSNNGKTITLSAAPSAAKPNATAAPAPAASTSAGVNPGATNPVSQPTPFQPAPANAQLAVHRMVVAVDPAHGGEDRGAALADRLAEKEVTLGFGRLLRHELEVAGFAVLLLRDGDNTVTNDQRAGLANAAHAALYINLHAVSEGAATGVYTSLLPVEGPSQGTFHAWNSAQGPALLLSQQVGSAVTGQLQKMQFRVRQSAASLRPLNNVTMPAVGVELAPGPNGLSDLTSASYQQKAAAAVAQAVVNLRDRLAVQP